MSSDANAAIRALVDTFVADLEALVRRAALETVAEALGGAAPVRPSSAPTPTKPRATPPEARRATPSAARRAAPSPRASRDEAVGRVRRSATQIEATSERIVRHVQEHPGARSEDIRAALGLAKNEWQLTAKRLVDAGRLATRGEKRATTYYLKGAPKFGVVRRPGRGAPATPASEPGASPADEGS